MGEISIVLRPIFFALVIVFLLKPILEFLENRGLNRVMALALTYLFFFVLLGIVLGVLVPVVSGEVSQLVKAFPRYARDINDAVKNYQSHLSTLRMPPQAAKAVDSVLASTQSTTLSVLGQAPSYGMSILSLLLDFVLAPLLAFFILKDRSMLSRSFFNVVPEAWRPESIYLLYRINIVIQGVFRVMIILAVVVSLLATIGLIISGIPYALLLGFFGGFVQIVPYIGPIVGTVPAVIVAWVTRGGWYALGIGIYFIVLTQLASMVLTPIMMKDKVGVHPILVLLVLLISGALFGFWGVVLAVPAAAIINEAAAFALMSDEERSAAMLAEGISVD